MRVNNSTKYAVMAVGYIAKNQDKGAIKTLPIAKDYDMIVDYLQKALQDLVKAGIVRSKRGPDGGYSLAMPLNKITMLDVIEAIEGTMTVSIALEEHSKADRFLSKATKAYDNAIAQARRAFKDVKIRELI